MFALTISWFVGVIVMRVWVDCFLIWLCGLILVAIVCFDLSLLIIGFVGCVWQIGGFVLVVCLFCFRFDLICLFVLICLFLVVLDLRWFMFAFTISWFVGVIVTCVLS